jgi:hypothetical protein
MEKKGKKKLPVFHRNVQEMTNCLDILRKSAIKIRKMLEIISGICDKFKIVIFHVIFSFVSLGEFPLAGQPASRLRLYPF